MAAQFYNNENGYLLEYYWDIIHSEVAKGTAGSKDFKPIYLFIMNDIIYRSYLYYYFIKANDAQKVYKAVWPNKTLTATQKTYIAIKVTKEKSVNGIYYYHPKNGKVYMVKKL